MLYRHGAFWSELDCLPDIKVRCTIFIYTFYKKIYIIKHSNFYDPQGGNSTNIRLRRGAGTAAVTSRNGRNGNYGNGSNIQERQQRQQRQHPLMAGSGNNLCLQVLGTERGQHESSLYIEQVLLATMYGYTCGSVRRACVNTHGTHRPDF